MLLAAEHMSLLQLPSERHNFQCKMAATRFLEVEGQTPDTYTHTHTHKHTHIKKSCTQTYGQATKEVDAGILTARYKDWSSGGMDALLTRDTWDTTWTVVKLQIAREAKRDAPPVSVPPTKRVSA